MKETAKKLHIVFLDFDDIRNPLLAAGQARATVEVGKRLVKRGHKVTILCSRYPNSSDRVENGLKYRHIGLGSKNIRLNNFIYIAVLPFFVMKLKADVIIECFTAPISTLCSPLFTKIPVVAIPTSFEAERFSKLYHLPVHLIQNWGLKKYKYFLPYTQFLEIKMKKVNPNVISKIVPEGVGEEYFRIEKRKPEYILFLARFDVGQKGIDLLLKAYAKVSTRIKLPLLLVGHGPDKEKIVELIKKYSLEKKVSVKNAVYGNEKYKLLSKAAFVAFPSRNEGFPLFGLEALAAGLPLATFDIPGLSWTTRDVSLKAKPFNIDEYADIILKLSHEKVYSKMSKNARLFAKKYTWENVATEFETFLQLTQK